MATWKGKAGDLVEVTSADERKYNLMGYAPAPQKDLEHEDLRKAYDHWYMAPLAAGAGIVAGIPGLTALADTAADAVGQRANFEQNMAGLGAAFPVTTGVGQVAGMMGTGAAVAAMAPAGVAASTAAGLAAPLASSTFLGTAATIAVTAGAENAAMGLGYKFDQAALEHADTPEGMDKIFGHVGMDTLADFAIGAGVAGLGTVLPKAFRTAAKATQEWGQANMMEMAVGASKMQELEKQGKATKVGQWMNANGLLDMNHAKASAKVSELIDTLGPKFNEIKGQAEIPLPPTMQARLEQNLSKLLGSDFESTDLGKGYTVGRLHNLRDSLDSKINWKNLDHPYNAKLNEARGVVDNYLNNLFDMNDMAQGGALANEWKAVNNEFSMANLVKDSLGKANAVKEGSSWWKGPASFMLGSSLGHAGAKLVGAGIGMAEAYKGGRFGYLANKLGQVFQQTSKGMAHAVEHGFYGLGPYVAGQRPADASSYELKAAQLRHIASNTPDAMEKMGTALLEQGYPQEVSDQLVQRQVQVAQYLINKAPKSPYPGLVSAAPWSASEDDRAHWSDLYNTAHDVRHWIADPSPDKTEIAQLAYPGLVQRTRDIVGEQMATLNDIPMESRVWASNILQAPAEPLMNPQMFAILSMARQADDQPEQGDTPKPRAASSGLDGDMASSEQTGFERLQNRA
jgi:hypothetical protein